MLLFASAAFPESRPKRRKIIKIIANRCQILRLKCTKLDFGWGAGGAYILQRSFRPSIAGFKGPIFKGREGKGEKGKEGTPGPEEGRKVREESASPFLKIFRRPCIGATVQVRGVSTLPVLMSPTSLLLDSCRQCM